VQVHPLIFSLHPQFGVRQNNLCMTIDYQLCRLDRLASIALWARTATACRYYLASRASHRN